jgi:hypothetical protein
MPGKGDEDNNESDEGEDGVNRVAWVRHEGKGATKRTGMVGVGEEKVAEVPFAFLPLL